MTGKEKTKPLSIRLTVKNRVGVEQYAEKYQISYSDFINMAIANYIETNDLVQAFTGADTFKTAFREQLDNIKK